MIKEGETKRACVHSVDVLVSVVKRHKSLMCSVRLSSASSLVFTFHLYNLLFHFRFQFSLLYNSSNSFPVAIFHMFSLYSHGILGVVLTGCVANGSPVVSHECNDHC